MRGIDDDTKPASTGAASPIELDGKDLPAFCPNPRMPLWNHHPRVFLDLVPTGAAMCPYCGTHYRLKPGTVVGSH